MRTIAYRVAPSRAATVGVPLPTLKTPASGEGTTVACATCVTGAGGYEADMTEQNGRQQGQGKTGGLPGHHADARTRELPADQLDDTVAMGESVAPPSTSGQGTEEEDERRE